MTAYIATEDIYVARGVRAFSTGDTVPASVVENLGVQEKVSSSRTNAAKDAAAKAAPPAP
jgi:hypothetical protein